MNECLKWRWFEGSWWQIIMDVYVDECESGEGREPPEVAKSVVESTEEIVQFFREKQKGASKMQRFWDLVKDSTIVQGVITMSVVGVTCYLWATGAPVPQELWTADGIILGFFFGAKTQQIVRGR